MLGVARTTIKESIPVILNIVKNLNILPSFLPQDDTAKSVAFIGNDTSDVFL